MVTTWQLILRTAAGSTWALMMALSSMDQLRLTKSNLHGNICDTSNAHTCRQSFDEDIKLTLQIEHYIPLSRTIIIISISLRRSIITIISQWDNHTQRGQNHHHLITQADHRPSPRLFKPEIETSAACNSIGGQSANFSREVSLALQGLFTIDTMTWLLVFRIQNAINYSMSFCIVVFCIQT